MNNYQWLEKRRRLTIDNLRPWPDNPRLNPEESHITISDYAEDLVEESKEGFFDLLKSFAEQGVIPADPIVVWKNEDNEKYYVAEGNRRLIALKLLRDPSKAPKSIRGFVRKLANNINKDDFEKILVYIAPSFEDAEWYINQRNSISSLQRRWSRIQQQRWIMTLYEKYSGDVEILASKTRLSKSELSSFIRILKVWDIIKVDDVKNKLSKEVYDKATSYKFPITVLERFFSSTKVKEEWGLELDGSDVQITSNKESFYNAYAEFIRRIFAPVEGEIKIDTRTITSHFDEIIDSLPKVSKSIDHAKIDNEPTTNNEEETEGGKNTNDKNTPNPQAIPVANPELLLKNNPNRPKLVLSIYSLYTDSSRLYGLFDEFKNIPTNRYPNSIAASLRVFLDLAILNYIRREGLETPMQNHFKNDLRKIQLKARIEYLKTNKFSGKVQQIANRLLEDKQSFSLDVLNGYVHSEDTHYMSKENLNRFWDFLFPLFEFLLDIRDDNV